MNYSAWDTSGPSLIGRAFYQPGVVVKPAPAPKPARTKKPPKVKTKGWKRLVNVDAVRDYIADGHSFEEASKHFHHCERTIRRTVGYVKDIRLPLPPRKVANAVVKFSGYFRPDALAWIKANGGVELLRRLVDEARAA